MGRLSKRMHTQYDPKELVYSDNFPGESAPDHRGQLSWNSFVGVPFRSVQVAEFAYELGYLPDEEDARIASGLVVPHTADLQLLKLAQEVQLWPPGQRSAPIQIHLGELLPAPDPGAPLTKLIAFRQRYEDERVELMEALDDLIHQVAAEHRTPEETLRVCARRLARASDDIRRAGRARQLMWVRNSVAVTVAAGSAASAAAFSQWQWLLGLLSGYAVNLATASVGSAWTPGPFSYLHRVKRTWQK
jgi:hypothetical protein